MGLFSKIAGTISSTLQLGLGGPLLKNSSGAVEHRNAADSAYAVARGATPVSGNDLATYAFVTALTTLGTTSAVSTLLGGFTGTTRSVSGNLTIDTTTKDLILLVDASGGALTITLPAPSAGRLIWILDVTGSFNSTNTVTLARHGTEKINGVAASKVLSAPWGGWLVTSDGTDWVTHGKNRASLTCTASSTNWTCPPGVTAISGEGWGGGGGGGSGARNAINITSAASAVGAGGGGGGASLVAFQNLAVTPNTTYTITVGGGGNGGTAVGAGTTAVAGNDGSPGNDTTFGSLLTCSGGGGGTGGATTATKSWGGLPSNVIAINTVANTALTILGCGGDGGQGGAAANGKVGGGPVSCRGGTQASRGTLGSAPGSNIAGNGGGGGGRGGDASGTASAGSNGGAGSNTGAVAASSQGGDGTANSGDGGGGSGAGGSGTASGGGSGRGGNGGSGKFTFWWFE